MNIEIIDYDTYRPVLIEYIDFPCNISVITCGKLDDRAILFVGSKSANYRLEDEEEYKQLFKLLVDHVEESMKEQAQAIHCDLTRFLCLISPTSSGQLN